MKNLTRTCVLLAADNQSKMATEGGIDMLIDLLDNPNEHVQRQAAKALANLGVNGTVAAQQSPCFPFLTLMGSNNLNVVANKERIARAGGIKPLIALASSKQVGVAVEAIAALANLAVNGKISFSIFHITSLECI